MNLRLIATILVIVVAPICAQAQKPTPAKVTKWSKLTRREIPRNSISCSENIRIGKKMGPEYTALIEGLQDTDPESEVGHEISSTLDALDNLCGG